MEITMRYADTIASAEWSGGKITAVEAGDTCSYITLDTGWSFCLDAQYSPRVHVGDVAEVAGRIGFPIQGMRVDGYVLWFKDAAAMERDRQEQLAEIAAKRRLEYDANHHVWRTELDALPPPLKARMDRFVVEAGGFEPFFLDSGAYELFCCTEAVKFADYFRPRLLGKTKEEARKEVDGFRALSCDEQRKLVPFDSGHSGNTFGGAVMLGARVAMGLDV